ncbi:MAG: C40 family peptidase [Actinomycetota bacterium]|nr:C40 family peptidase [Actinomycetota bacterium]
MATAHDPAPRTPARASATARRLLLTAGAILGILFSAVPAQAAPSTAAQAAELVAARAHQLEVVTEEFNEARAVLTAQRAAAEAAAARLAEATAELEASRQQVRGIARTAYTGEGIGSLRALLTSDSADDFVDRVAVLQSIAGHQNDVVRQAAEAGGAAAAARTVAEQAAAEAQVQYDAVAAQQAALQVEIDGYQAEFDALSAREQRAAVAGHHGERASRAEREPTAAAGPVVASSGAAQAVVDAAMAQRGKPYVWAGSGPASFDCSGLTSYAFRAAGIALPHSSRMQARLGQPVPRDQLKPGDLVFFYEPVSHVGIYIGNGQMVHAPTFGDVVKVSPLMGGFSGARRIAG